MINQDYIELEEEYYDLLRELSEMKHNMKIMKSCIGSMIAKGAEEPVLNGDPISSHDFWRGI